MKRILLLIVLLGGCVAPSPPSDPPSLLSRAQQEHPGWFACESESDCIEVPSECATTCRGAAVNNAAYSDYVVWLADECAGAPQQPVKQCTEYLKECSFGKCQLT